MPSSASATVAQNNLSGTELLFTDTGTYTGVVSRTLTVYDYLGNIVTLQSLGSVTTYILTISSDNWYQFQCVVVDANGTWKSTVYFVATGFYTAAYLNQFTTANCGCQGNNCNLEIAENFLNAALRYNLAGLSGAANSQACIVAANVFVNQSPVVQLT